MIKKLLHEAVVKMIHKEWLGKITTFSCTLRTSASRTASGLFGLSFRQKTLQGQGLLQKRISILGSSTEMHNKKKTTFQFSLTWNCMEDKNNLFSSSVSEFYRSFRYFLYGIRL